MTVWAHEASRRWNGAWVGGAGPFACVVNYRKGKSVTLFRTLREAEAHKRRLDTIQPEKALWTTTEIVNLKTVRTHHRIGTTTTRGQR
jgi:hypothetical protein